MEKNKNFSLMSQLLYYGMDGKHSTAAGIVYELDKPIDFNIMEAAYLRAIKRFPYFNVKLKMQNNALYREWVDEPLALQKDAEDYLINENENSGYLYRVSVNGNKLSIQIFHGLTDGSGINSLAKLILLLYYEKSGEEISGINDYYKPDEEVDIREYMDPLDSEIFKGVAGTKINRSNFLIVPEKKDRVLDINYFSCDGVKLMEYAKNSDGTPNAVTSIMIAKSYLTIHPESLKKPVRVAITINGKQFIGLEKNTTPFLNVSDFDFDEKKLAMDNEKLHTCVRGKIFRDCYDDIILSKLAASKGLGQMYKLMPSLQAKKLLSSMTKDIPSSTFCVSYAGRCNMGTIEQHINSVYSYADGAVPLMEINYADGKFFFCLSTRFDGKKYMDAFAEEFKRVGISISEIKTLHFKEGKGQTSKKITFGFNKATLELIRAAGKMKKK